MRSSRPWWWIFAACAAGLVLVLAWMTTVVIRLEEREREARADAAYQESLRLALWRMDSWLGPRLAREAARPVSDYAVATGGSARPFDIRLRFEVSAAGDVVATDLPAAGEIPNPKSSHARVLAAVREIAATEDLPRRVADAEAALADIAGMSADIGAPVEPGDRFAAEQLAGAALETRARQELMQRQLDYMINAAPPAAPEAPAGGAAGPLVPLWVGAETPPGELELIFVRRVGAEASSPGDALIQGFLCDWEQLRATLLARIADLFPAAMLVPVPGSAVPGSAVRVSADSPETLASVPAVLRVTAAAPRPAALFTPATTTLAAMWLAVIAALAAVAITLRASIAFGEKRSRFASAVTHELRTPLTTFRLYAEMLDEGMVTSDEQRRSYLRTLREEADRLGAIVENVLAYARLERGAAAISPRDVTLGALFDEIVPALWRRAERGGMTLTMTVDDPAAALRLDVEGVSQILANLVDNAVKYAAEAENRVIAVSARVGEDDLIVAVRDHGPGIAAGHARSIFAPFERGPREPGDTTPGVGLGLALSRGLARRMGGELRIVSGQGHGACFEVMVPSTRP